MIGLHGRCPDRKRLPGKTHEIERDPFPRRPADSFVGDGAAASGKNDRAKTVNASGVKGLDARRAANTQRAPPDLQGGSIFTQEK